MRSCLRACAAIGACACPSPPLPVPFLPVPSRPFPSQARTKKIFVGGLDPKTTVETFQAHFERFGAVLDASIMLDHEDHRSRGFGFVTFASEETVDAVIAAGSQVRTVP